MLSFLASITASHCYEEPYEPDAWCGLYEIGWAVETPLLIASALVLAVFVWKRWPFAIHRLFAKAGNPGLGMVRTAIAFAGVWFAFVLVTGAAEAIRDPETPFYLLLYFVLGYAALYAAAFTRPILDLYYPADVVERGNLAAGLVYAGFVLGTAFAFGGALTGEGPGWWVVVVFFLMAYFELRATLGLVSQVAGVLKDDVRIDRDVSAGLLLGAVAAAGGLVSGRAAAGDFLGWGPGLADYAQRLWGLLVVAFGGMIVGALSRRSEQKLRIRAIGSGALVAFGLGIYFFT